MMQGDINAFDMGDIGLIVFGLGMPRYLLRRNGLRRMVAGNGL